MSGDIGGTRGLSEGDFKEEGSSRGFAEMGSVDGA